MFFAWINVTANTIAEILWYLDLYPRPQAAPSSSKPSEGKEHDPLQPSQPLKPEPPTQATLPPHSQFEQDQLKVTLPPQPISLEIPPSRLYALVIGINDYEHTTPLTGAVPDADAMVNFLKTSLSVPDGRIKNLRNREATRSKIRESIRSLATCDDINPGDPILIYYAGHGTEGNSPKDWPSAGGKIQMLMPCDFVPKTTTSESGQGLLDITLSILLDQLSKSKGNNITVILDSCHSASGTRDDSDNSRVGSRGINLPNDYTILSTVDQDIRSASRGDSIAPGFETSGLASHVLLAGCMSTQTSKEDRTAHHGYFTTALLKALETDGTDKMSYEELIERLDVLTDQNPQCEGIHKSRILFDAKVSAPRLVLHLVTEKGSGKYELDAGEAYGITVGATFNVYAIMDPKSDCLGTLVVTSTTAFTSDLTLPSGASAFSITSQPAYALQTSVGEKQDLQVSIADDDRLLEVYEQVKVEMDKNRSIGKRGIKLVEKTESPDLVLTIQNTDVEFIITNKLCVERGLTKMPYTISSTDATHIFSVITGAADFYYHLNRTSSRRTLTNLRSNGTKPAIVGLECREVEYGDELDDEDVPLLEARGDDLIKEGDIDLVESDKKYGFKITNNSATIPLYAALFYFNMSDLSINSYYQPNKARGLADLEPCIPPNSSLTIGYGSGGHPPRRYFFDGEQKIDVGFVKLFVSSQPVDFSHIPQRSPFTAERADVPVPPPRPKLWDSVLVRVVLRKATK